MSGIELAPHYRRSSPTERAGSFPLSFISLITASHTQAGLHCTCQLSAIISPNTDHTLKSEHAVCARIQTAALYQRQHIDLRTAQGLQASANLNDGPKTKRRKQRSICWWSLGLTGGLSQEIISSRYPRTTTPSTEIQELKASTYDPIPQNSDFTNKERLLILW